MSIKHGTELVYNADVVGNWGTFESSDLESQYRQQQTAYDSFQSQMFLTIIVLASLALTLTDYRLFGFSRLFWWVIAIRVGFAFVSLGTIVALQRGLHPHNLYRIVFAMSLGNIAVVAWLNTPSDQLTGRAVIVAFVVANVLGSIIARQVHYWKRQQFVAILRQTELLARLEQALAQIKTLRGILPICSHCKSVRDDTGYWQQVEVYVRDRTYAEFSHAICPTCLQRHYADLLDA